MPLLKGHTLWAADGRGGQTRVWCWRTSTITDTAKAQGSASSAHRLVRATPLKTPLSSCCTVRASVAFFRALTRLLLLQRRWDGSIVAKRL